MVYPDRIARLAIPDGYESWKLIRNFGLFPGNIVSLSYKTHEIHGENVYAANYPEDKNNLWLFDNTIHYNGLTNDFVDHRIEGMEIYVKKIHQEDYWSISRNCVLGNETKYIGYSKDSVYLCFVENKSDSIFTIYQKGKIGFSDDTSIPSYSCIVEII